MGISTYPAVSSPIKSIQRGTAATAGNITITAVNTAKTMVNSFSTSSSGTVAASGTINAASGSTGTHSINIGVPIGAPVYYPQPSVSVPSRYGATPTPFTPGSGNANAMNVSLNATNLTGGTTNLVAGVNGVYLSNSTTLVATGPCRYEVIEYY